MLDGFDQNNPQFLSAGPAQQHWGSIHHPQGQPVLAAISGLSARAQAIWKILLSSFLLSAKLQLGIYFYERAAEVHLVMHAGVRRCCQPWWLPLFRAG